MDNKNSTNNNCCNKKAKNPNGLRHGLMISACCLIPVMIILLLPLLGIKGISLGSLAFIICPLLHVGMMLFLMRSRKDHSCHKNSDNNSIS